MWIIFNSYVSDDMFTYASHYPTKTFALSIILHVIINLRKHPQKIGHSDLRNVHRQIYMYMRDFSTFYKYLEEFSISQKLDWSKFQMSYQLFQPLGLLG